MPKRATSIQFDEAVDQMLRLFKKVSGTSLAVIANRAIEGYIKSELHQNAGLKAKYETEEAKVLASAGGNVSMIPRRKPRNRNAA